MKRFSKDFNIHYYEVDSSQYATIPSILNYLQDTAISHSASIGLGVSDLIANGACWVLSRWSLIIDKYPVINERISIETWPWRMERFYAWRDFLIKNSNGEVIAKASSLWIYIDIAKRRPIRIPSEYSRVYGLEEDMKSIENPFSDFDASVISSDCLDFNVRRSDIDTNNHVNNTRYIEWILEAVPDRIYDNYRIKSLEIIYKKETRYGGAVCSGYSISAEKSNAAELLHTITDKDSKTELAIAKTIWEKS
jgi:acyl-ACP thioesterase